MFFSKIEIPVLPTLTPQEVINKYKGDVCTREKMYQLQIDLIVAHNNEPFKYNVERNDGKDVCITNDQVVFMNWERYSRYL